MSSISVVINADDFGLTDGVCAGIVQAIQRGVVTSTTAMVCVSGYIQRLKSWGPKIAGRIGAHLQLTSGTPIMPAEKIPSLVQRDGSFFAKRKQIHTPKTEEVLAEWQAQLETLLGTGVEPTHLDSHHHVHGLDGVFPAFCELANLYSLPVRSLSPEMTLKLQAAGVPSIGHTLTDWYGGELSASTFMEVLQKGARENPGCSSFEVMCHPGYAEEGLALVSGYVLEREIELATLCDPALKRELIQAGFVCRGIPARVEQNLPQVESNCGYPVLPSS